MHKITRLHFVRGKMTILNVTAIHHTRCPDAQLVTLVKEILSDSNISIISLAETLGVGAPKMRDFLHGYERAHGWDDIEPLIREWANSNTARDPWMDFSINEVFQH